MSSFDPYKPPQYIEEKPIYQASFGPPPQVLTWYKIYAGAMALLYALLFVMGGIMLVASTQARGEDQVVLVIQGIVFMVMSVPLTIFFGFGLFLPRKKWGWIYGIVTIALGLTSPCCMPITIPLLIYWIKPETKAYFGA